MGFMDKRYPRMQGKFYILKSGGADRNFRLEFENFRLICGGHP